tara:strand:- start:8308 stop:9960 length:1653 start_codon:yes stop_codon:yes gene_type:complete
MNLIRYCCLITFFIYLPGCSLPDGGHTAAGTNWFEDEARSRGIDFVHVSGYGKQTNELALLPEIVGSGAALVDIDSDGDLDAYFVQGGGRYAENLKLREPNRLYINRGDGTFEKSLEMADRGYGMGVAVGDYDDDGDMDIYVTNVGPNTLWRNDGNYKFKEVSLQAGVNDDGWGTAAAFVDADNDGDLDLFVVNYIEWSLSIERECRIRGVPTYCSPNTYGAPAQDRLYENKGDGTFADVTESSGVSRSYGNGLGLGIGDFNKDGRVDIFVANDQTINQLWINQGDMRFVNVAAEYGVAMDDMGLAKAGMGVAVEDLDDDADLDLLVVNLGGETDSFYRNEGHFFVDHTHRIGLSSTRDNTRFGVVLADFDNDGLLDLYEANGKVDASVLGDDDAFAETNRLYKGVRDQEGVSFINSEFNAMPKYTSRAAAVGDIDNNGTLDVLVTNRDAAPFLLMNKIGSQHNWIRIDIRDRNGSPVIGARVSAVIGGRTVNRELRVANSFLSSSEPIIHFGLGSEKVVNSLVINYPSGQKASYDTVDAGQVFVPAPMQ